MFIDDIISFVAEVFVIFHLFFYIGKFVKILYETI